MSWPESVIAVGVIVVIFFVLLINFWGVFDLVFDQIRCQYIATHYFKILYNEGDLTSEQQGALSAELTTRGVTVGSIQVQDAAEWGDPVALTVTGTIAMGTKMVNGATQTQTVPFRFERHSLASALKEATNP